MGELFNLDDYRRSRPQANLVPRLDSVAGPAIPVPYANLSKIPTKELQRIVNLESLAYQLVGLEGMLGSQLWTEQEVVDHAQLVNDAVNELDDTDRDYMFGRAEAIRAFEQEQLSS